MMKTRSVILDFVLISHHR